MLHGNEVPALRGKRETESPKTVGILLVNRLSGLHNGHSRERDSLVPAGHENPALDLCKLCKECEEQDACRHAGMV